VDLQNLKKEIDYYLFRLPCYSLYRPGRAYEKIRVYSGMRIWEERRQRVARNLRIVFGERIDDEALDVLSRRFFEVLCCDDIDAWLRLFRPWNWLKNWVRIEEGKHFSEIARAGRGCVLLSTHFGGGFFVFDVARDLGGKPEVLGRPIRREYFRDDVFRWAYLKFRIRCMEHALGTKMIFSERKETRKDILDRLERGHHLYVTFDVPPHFTKGQVETVKMLGRDWRFPRGFLEVIAGRDIPVVPVFVTLTDSHQKIFRFYPPHQIRNQNEIGPVLQECANIFETYLVRNPEQWFFWDDAAVFW
jgi:lauroyl/myristoyl acyltransferase